MSPCKYYNSLGLELNTDPHWNTVEGGGGEYSHEKRYSTALRIATKEEVIAEVESILERRKTEPMYGLRTLGDTE
tara:strand:+ start:12655 stop:12879 length:225 start_codon:yes stop_codon:yes gene_type:complete